jgi:alpha/beta superfamily hydrolase
MKYIMSIAILFIFTSCVNTNYKITKREHIQVKKTAMKAIKMLGGQLKKNMKKKMKTKGIEGATKFCVKRASIINNNVNKRLKDGVKISRISLKNRNSENYPENSDEIAVLKKYAKTKSKKLVITKVGTNHYKVYKPMYINAKCLMCHGNKKQTNKKVCNIIKSNYPNDKAKNYKLGDFRGAFLVDIVK